MCACVTVVSLSKPVVWLLPSCSDTLFPCLMRKCCWYVRLQTHTNAHKHKHPDTQFFSCERWGGCLGCELLLWLSAVSHKLETCCYLIEKIHREKSDALHSHFILFVLIVVPKLCERSEFRSYINSDQIDVKTQQQNLALLAVTTELIECFRFFKSCLQKAFSEIFETIKSIKTKQHPPFSLFRLRGHKTSTLLPLQGNCERHVRFIFLFLCCRGSPDSSCVPVPPLPLSPLWCCRGKKRKKEKSSSHSSLADAVKNVNVSSLLC